MIEFKLENSEFIELNHLLKVTGLCDSGGIANTAISDGQVIVDGNTELRKRCNIRAGQVIEFNNRKIIVIASSK